MFLRILALFNMALLAGLYVKYGLRDIPDEFGFSTAQMVKYALGTTPMCLVMAICLKTLDDLRPAKLADPHRGFLSKAVYYAFHCHTLASSAFYALIMAISVNMLVPRLFEQPLPKEMHLTVWQHVVYFVCVIWPGATDMTIAAAKRYACKSRLDARI